MEGSEWGLLVEFWQEAPTQSRRGFHTTAREPKRAHLRVPAFHKHHQNSTKGPTREGEKRLKTVAGEGKKKRNFGSATKKRQRKIVVKTCTASQRNRFVPWIHYRTEDEMSGNFIYRHHVETRVKLYSPREESFRNPLKYIDVSRTTHENLDVNQERRIDDYWNIDGSRDLSGSWTGFTQFTLLEEKPPDRCMLSGGRLTRKQLTSGPDHPWSELWKSMGKHAKQKEKQKWSNEKFHLENARKLRGIYFIDPEDMEFKETIKNAREKLETSVAPAMPDESKLPDGNSQNLQPLFMIWKQGVTSPLSQPWSKLQSQLVPAPHCSTLASSRDATGCAHGTGALYRQPHARPELVLVCTLCKHRHGTQGRARCLSTSLEELQRGNHVAPMRTAWA